MIAVTVRIVYLALILAIALFGVGTAFGVDSEKKPENIGRARPITILVLMDGFRSDYIDRGVTPNLKALAADGVRGTVTPAFPSVSAPNHFTQITGLYPDEHGIVGNVMEDKAIPVAYNPFFTPGSTDDLRWWRGHVPLWALAEEQGMKATRTHWPAVGRDRKDTSGRNNAVFDGNPSPDQVAVRFLQWFDVAPNEIPSISFLYFDQADGAGHRYGPDSPETTEAIAKVDAAIGKVVEGLKQRGLWDQANIVFTADHGMTKYVPGQVVFLDDFVDASRFRVLLPIGAYAEVYPENGATVDELARTLTGNHGPVTCWRKEDLPARFHFGKHKRVPPIICLADPGWVIVERAGYNAQRWITGAGHGYDPDASGMGAVFVAHGPAFCPRTLSRHRIDAVDIYPLLARLSGIKPEANSGNIANLTFALRSGGQCPR